MDTINNYLKLNYCWGCKTFYTNGCRIILQIESLRTLRIIKGVFIFGTSKTIGDNNLKLFCFARKC